MLPNDKVKKSSDERAVEIGQQSRVAQIDLPQGDTVGYFEPHDLDKLAQNGRLYLVADSVSGMAAGEIAAQYAIKKILHTFYAASHIVDLKERLLKIIHQTNIDIYERNEQYPDRRPMAITLMAALIYDNNLFVANVGDNRAYVAWDQDIELLREEADQAPTTPLEKSEGETDNGSSETISSLKPVSLQEADPRVLGLTEKIKIETYSRRLFAGDMVILSSHNLVAYVREQEIARAVTRHSPKQAIPRLISLAAQRGNRDHIALSVIKVLSSTVAIRPPQKMALPAAPLWSEWDPKINPTPDAPTQPHPVIDKPASTSEAEKTTKVPEDSPSDTKKTTGPSAPTAPIDVSALKKPPVSTVEAGPSTKTAPMSKAIIPVTPSVFDIESESRSWLKWQNCAVVALITLCFFCTVPWLIWQYLIPPEMMVSLPYIGELDATLRETVGLETTEELVVATDEIQDDSPDSTPTGGQQQVSPIETPSPETGTAAISEIETPQTDVPTTAAVRLFTPTPTPNLPTSTPSPTPAPTITVPANCENKGRFRDDVTIPDGTELASTEAFEKVWRVQNAGDCPWGPGYTIRFIGGDALGGPEEVPLTELIEPDENGDLAVPLVAPIVPGTYNSVWQLHDLEGEPFGPELYLEIEVIPSAIPASGGDESVLFDFIDQASQANWSSEDVIYLPLSTPITEELDLSQFGGIVAIGPAELRGNIESEGDVLLTYPHQEIGFIEGVYEVDVPLQPTDSLVATLGFLKQSILSDDGVTFEVVFTPADGTSTQVILSREVQYRDSPVTELQPLTDLAPNQTGTFTLRVLGNESVSQDWAVWIDLRLIRP